MRSQKNRSLEYPLAPEVQLEREKESQAPGHVRPGSQGERETQVDGGVNIVLLWKVGHIG